MDTQYAEMAQYQHILQPGYLDFSKNMDKSVHLEALQHAGMAQYLLQRHWEPQHAEMAQY